MERQSKKAEGFLLILREAPLHPNSYLKKIESAFEVPSIIHIYSMEGLRRYTSPPAYNNKYLIIFDSFRVLQSNKDHIKFSYMLPIYLCETRGQVDDAVEFCKDKEVPYRIFYNEFKHADAQDLIASLITRRDIVPKTFPDTLIRRVGLSPQRIISAMMVCSQVGYTTANVAKYVDKYTYIDIYDVIESLLHITKSEAQRKRAALYVHQNRVWFKTFTRQLLLREVDLLLKLYRDITQGDLTEYTLKSYAEESRIPRYRVLYAVDLYNKIAYVTLRELKQFLEHATVLELVLRMDIGKKTNSDNKATV